MTNIMVVDGFRAVIKYDPKREIFRGEFLGINGGADFYASDIESLKKEAATSLKVFLEMCEEEDIEPRKEYSGKLNLRMPAELHADIVSAATAEGKSLNQWVVDTLGREIDKA